MTFRQTTDLDHLLRMEDRIIAQELVLRGKFKAEIARLEPLVKELEEKMGVVETLEAAAKIKADADIYAASIKTEAELALAEAKKKSRDALLALSDTQAKIKQDTAELAEEKRALSVRASELNKQQEEVSKRELAVASRELAVSDAEKHHSNKAADLHTRERKLNASLDALKV